MTERGCYRRVGMVLTRALACASFVFACTTDYQKGLDDPKYGSANAFADGKQPGSSTDRVAQNEAGSTASPIACVTTGGTLVDGGGTGCPSFAADVLAVLGRSTCASTTCHGGATPPAQPRILLDDPRATWKSFASFKMSSGDRPYINPCSTDEARSAIACNLYAEAPCGIPMPQGGPATSSEDIAVIERWLACGALDN